jgi:hypothetical protein
MCNYFWIRERTAELVTSLPGAGSVYAGCVPKNKKGAREAPSNLKEKLERDNRTNPRIENQFAISFFYVRASTSLVA